MLRNRLVWPFAAAIAAVLALAPAASAYPGDLDTSFNSVGYTFTEFPGERTLAADVAVQDDGKVVVVGTYGDRHFAVARYDTDGTLDETFDGDGLVTTPMNDAAVPGGVGGVRATSVVIQPDDKIVVGGTARVLDGMGNHGNGLALARYLPSGTLDPGFGTGGRAHTYITGAAGDFCSGVGVNALALHEDTIYASAGKLCEGQDGPFVARYLTGGSLDPTYGPGGPDGINGVAHTDSHANGAVDLIVTASGAAIVVGRAYGFFGSRIALFTPAGSPDPDFGSGGVVERPNEIVSVVAVPDGKFVTLTRFGSELRLSLARFNATNGAIDSTFGSGGTVMTHLPASGPGSFLDAHDLARDADGRLLAVSRRSHSDSGKLVRRTVLHKWTADGVFDTHFGNDGESQPVPTSSAAAIAIDGSNRPIAAATCECNPDPETGVGQDGFAVARYQGGIGGNRTPTASFTWTPNQPQTKETVTFDATASDDLDGAIANYSWDLDGSGDFETDAGSSPHLFGSTFSRPGQRTVRLRVTDQDGATAITTREITVIGRPPTARLTASPSAAFTNQSVIFDAHDSTDPDGTIVNYRFDLDGDGIFERDNGTNAAVVAAFGAPGRHTVRVRVTDDTGMQATADVTVTVVARENETGGTGTGTEQPPGGSEASVSINRGARYTRSRVVTVSILPPAGATAVELSNARDFSGAQRFDIMPTGTYRWRLDPRGSQRVPKRVYVRFVGSLVAAPGAVFSDSIVLDETVPRLLQPRLVRARSGAVRAVRVSASDLTSGVRGVHVTTNRRRPGSLRRYRRVVAFTASRSAPVYVRVVDRAGNTSRWRRAR